MKRIICVLLTIASLVTMIGCSSESAKTPDKEGNGVLAKKIDVDLTKLSSTMVYSKVYNMVTKPSEYVGQTVKMNGTFTLFHSNETGLDYYACIIADATACCSQGIEFVLAGDSKYPDDYPELGSEIVVQGEFDTYMEGPQMYCHLINATLK